jgi:hypothetical protein
MAQQHETAKQIKSFCPAFYKKRAAGGINSSKKIKKIGWAGLSLKSPFFPAHPRPKRYRT